MTGYHSLTGIVRCVPHIQKSGGKEFVDHGSYVPRDSGHYKGGKHDYDYDHESVLGSHTVAEEYEHLPPEEAKKRLFSLALKMDANGDKYVDKKELIDWVLKSFKSLTEEEAMDEMEDEDKNDDGKVTWEEHVSETYGMYGDDLVVNQTPEDMEMLENDRELFKAADVNGNGVLEKSEYSGFSHPEELNICIRCFTTTEHFAIEKDRFINDLDLNGDHKLSREEVLICNTAKNEVAHLIKSSDTDEDGKLSIQEIVDHYDIFVGSEATDFGEQLQHQKYKDEL
ncbi:calumenin [Caerostris extrusa]|uniref:Reticulocalbin-3 n=1 Tax=Caerostris extrusa TaxID=172846 RepID=A0AAV4T546_CAEEX|nr:calumenin [Caerostris extrusa]